MRNLLTAGLPDLEARKNLSVVLQDRRPLWYPDLMEACWYIGCRSKELRRQPIGVTIVKRPLALFRGAQGRPAAVEDRCLHRGAPLAAGAVESGHLACPYHGWRYAMDGSVAHIPAMPGGCPIPEHFRVPAYSCLEQDGFVWVHPDPSIPISSPRRFPFLGERGWSSFVLKTIFRAPVEACLENFLDCPHATTVHRTWFRTPTSKTIRAIVRTLPDGAEAEYLDEPREKSVVWTLIAPSKEHRMRHTDRFIAPSTTEVDYQFSNDARYLITSACTPVDDSTTLVHTVITFRFGWLTPFIRLFFKPLARQIIQQDVSMLDRLQENAARFGRPRFTVIPQDLLMPHILQWRNALRNGAPVPAAGREEHVDLRL